MNYSDLRWSIIQEWNSDAKFTTQFLIEKAKEINVEIKNIRADRKSIIAKVVDGVITSGVESGEYKVSDMGEDTDSDIKFKRYMGDLDFSAPTLQVEDNKDEHEHEDGTVHSHPHEGKHSHDEDKEEEELPNFKKMSKKKLDDWALERGIELDRRKTKSRMIEELKLELEAK